MSAMATVSDALALIRGIESGAIDVTLPNIPDEGLGDGTFGDVEYQTSNGWRVVVFNDCGSWDYIDHFVAPDGTRIEVWPESDVDLLDRDNERNQIAFYRPHDTTRWPWPR